VGSTMIEEDPETGMLAINKDKALKTTMSAVSYVNKKVNNLSRAMKKGGR
jgi:ubiquinone/menaquinone biosynthesis C-methylase UbiE